MILLSCHYIAAKTSTPGKVYMHLVLQTAVPTMKQAVQKPETMVFIKPAAKICYRSDSNLCAEWNTYCHTSGKQTHKNMNADYFWLLMGAFLIIAIILQISSDKRHRRKHGRRD